MNTFGLALAGTTALIMALIFISNQLRNALNELREHDLMVELETALADFVEGLNAGSN